MKNYNWLQFRIQFLEENTFEEEPRAAMVGYKKPFSDLKPRSKRKRTEELRKSYDADQLLFSAESKFRSEGQLEKSMFSSAHTLKVQN